MRALILSDIHANLEALEAVIDDSRRQGGFDTIWCLGDTVGYGPDPGPCIEVLQGHTVLAVAGNHDHAATGRMSVEYFNDAAAAAARWTGGQLSGAEAAFLDSLPQVVTSGVFTLVHGSLRAPLWEYLLEERVALATLELLETPYCLVGHSHIPFLCRESQGALRFTEFTENTPFHLPEERWIINPGGVGQPRDRDPRPSYAIYDSTENIVERRRVTYDIATTQEKMRRARLPESLATRLDFGI